MRISRTIGIAPAGFAAALALALCTPHAARAQWVFDFEGTRVNERNVPRAQRANDIVHDSASLLSASGGRRFELDPAGSITLTADTRAARYESFGGLSHAALGTTLAYRRKLGLGLTAPWVAASASAAGEDYREPLRDGSRVTLGATLGRRFNEHLDSSFAFAYERRSQRRDVPRVLNYSDKVFDTQARSLSFKANYAPDERWMFSLALGFRRGDVVSSTRRNLAILRASNAVAADPAFGPDYVAYRLSGATTRSVSLGVSWALDERSSLDATYSIDRTAARGGLDYDGSLFGVSFVHRR